MRTGISTRLHKPALVLTLMLVHSGGCSQPVVATVDRVAGATTRSTRGTVVSVSAPASEIGCDVLMHGGTAVDAAVATAFALAVTYPEAGNIGGGGFMVIHPGHGEAPVVIDYRETAPAAATRDMFVHKSDRTPYRLAGVPGTVRGLALAHARHGRRPWQELIEPAIELASDGFEMNATLARSLNRALARPGDEAEEMRRVLGKQGGGEWMAGDRLEQPELAGTLRRIAAGGPDAFYRGPVAEAIVATLTEHGGIMTTEDLAGYQAKVRSPVHGTYRGFDVYGPPPPSSGGICVVQMLNVLETFELRRYGRWSPETLHLMIEAMRRAFHDRARYLGDTDFVEVLVFLTTKAYARELAATIDAKQATRSATLAPDLLLAEEGPQTTHFSVIDANGMAVSNTYTLEQSYGGRIMVKQMGFLLNNEMGDFNPVPGVTDRRGQIGTPPNEVAPGKRMLSSMTPVIVAKDGRPAMITGSPGGRTIINTVLCVLINRLEFDMSPRDCVVAPRISMTWLPDVVTLEPGLARDHAAAIDSLKAIGHIVNDKPREQGDAHSIFIEEDGTIVGVADRRRNGAAAGY